MERDFVLKRSWYSTMHARVVPETSSPQTENPEERFSNEDNLPLSEVIAIRQRMRELQG